LKLQTADIGEALVDPRSRDVGSKGSDALAFWIILRVTLLRGWRRRRPTDTTVTATARTTTATT